MSWWRPDDGLDPKYWGRPPNRLQILRGKAFMRFEWYQRLNQWWVHR